MKYWLKIGSFQLNLFLLVAILYLYSKSVGVKNFYCSNWTLYLIAKCDTFTKGNKNERTTFLWLIYSVYLLDEFWMLFICAEDGIYLAYSDFHPYLLGDSSSMKELNQWFSKQLDSVCRFKTDIELLYFIKPYRFSFCLFA